MTREPDLEPLPDPRVPIAEPAFARVGPVGAERPVVRVAGKVFDASPVADDIDSELLAGPGLGTVADAARGGQLEELATDGPRFGAPIATPGKVVCIGLNYHDHARETGAEPPAEPVVFMKDPGCMVGPGDGVLIPRTSTATDWEVELAVVIGRTARYLEDPSDAAGHIAGVAVANDVSERDFQLLRGGGQWDKGKSCETFFPLGPWLVPLDALDDVQDLEMSLSVNGTRRQHSNTTEMIFGVEHLVWHLSQFMVLFPGDVISTGTPAGVALGLPDNPYLREGDVMELEIAGLGRQRQMVTQA